MRRPETVKRIKNRVDALKGQFDEYVEVFNIRNLFTGPNGVSIEWGLW